MKRQPSPSSDKKTRRDFIKTTAVTTAGVFLGSHALARASLTPARSQDSAAPQAKPTDYPPDCRDKVRLGLIGTGGMGGAHLDSFLIMRRDMLENVEITALCDVARPRLEDNLSKVKEFQGTEAKGYGDYRKLLESKDVDCVLIASPEHWHAQMAIDAMDAGKDVYVEKPMTLRLDDALRLYRFAWGRKERITVGTQYVTYPRYQEAKRLIAEGAIGHPTSSQTSYCRNSKDGEWLYYEIDERVQPGTTLDWKAWCGALGPAPWDPQVYFRWRRYSKWSTGIIGDLLVHKMTPLIMALDPGWPVHVTATGGHYVDKAMDNHDQVNITARFEKDHTMLVAGSTCNEYGLEEIIRGHKGNLFTGGDRMVLRPERIWADEVMEQTFNYEGIDPHNTIRRDFLNCARTRKEPISNVELATKCMVVVDLATRCMWEGKSYSFNPKTMTAQPV
ncbi:MAG: Gfo/Idh/MocA family oxidoreductase [Planctomycetota bacterium]